MTRMKRLFAGTVHVHYGTMHFLGGEEDFAGGNECFEGQVNGLCGAAMRTSLVLRTGLHTGGVKVTVDFWDKEPPLEDSWEEVVEVSFVVNDPERTGILEWGGRAWHPIDLRRGRYRVRYCARNMDAGRHKDTLLSDVEDVFDVELSDVEEPVDEYSLSFWFVPAGAPDRLIRQTSETAAMWHQWAERISRESGQGAPQPYSQRARSGAAVITAKRIRFVAPTYPQKALEEGLSGSVTVDFIVDVNGEPTEVRIADASPSGTFDQAVLEALKHWRYEPYRLDGVPTPIPDRVVFRFDPKSA
jgi:TonB family protein